MINAIIVSTRVIEPGRYDFSMKEKLINPKESTFKKILGEGLPEPKICSVSLRELWPGHVMRILDEEAEAKQRRQMEKLTHWTFADLGQNIRGNAVIFGIEQSEPAHVRITIRDLMSRLLNISK